MGARSEQREHRSGVIRRGWTVGRCMTRHSWSGAVESLDV
jgi:hypothetical protein